MYSYRRKGRNTAFIVINTLAHFSREGVVHHHVKTIFILALPSRMQDNIYSVKLVNYIL